MVNKKILGPNRIKYEFLFHLKPNHVLYKTFEVISTTMKKRRMSFYENMKRMEPDRLANKILISHKI